MQISTSKRAAALDGTYPRPQLRREAWADLTGEWEFAYDDDDRGRHEGWHLAGAAFDRTITVPFPPESPASGIGDTGFHPIVWYRRHVSTEDLGTAGAVDGTSRVLVHFGAVDFRSEVWADGRLLGVHEGGQTPFALEIPADLVATGFSLVVRAEDDHADVSQPRGKQDWLEEPHVIWYHRTTGIWQPVWLEAVPDDHLVRLGWAADLVRASVDLRVRLSRRPRRRLLLDVRIEHDGVELAAMRTPLREPEQAVTLHLPDQGNGQAYERLLWSPERPTLLDARLRIVDEDGTVVDEVLSYLGLRSVDVHGGRFLLNDRPYYVRSVLEQGYWPETHLAAPGADALRAEVELIRELGFNAVRLHEKAEDPRLLFWADRLGLLVWGEIGSAFEFSPRAIERTVTEWMEVVTRDASHPSIVTWVPINESWGVQHASHDPAQQAYIRALFHLTKALDPTRPVISNDGWEHAESDLLTIHDYATSGAELRRSYGDEASVDALVSGVGPAGRRLTLTSAARDGAPVMVTEFGGVSFAPSAPADAWGYSAASTAEDFERRLRDLVGALQASPVLAGFCYTQLTDTRQETNGLTDEHRRPKLPVETLRSIVLGETAR
ncbi:glycoside hydrolase family 2 protein [Agromyces silvae]|uniref:glycoside hydrolase family 2 protein n=1 Tax=Agromyces silvae TaxID=3388266 RepID=UPI00280C0BA6|nr:glycoside hydrolase family 2 TIM barrel-domain containing protein [Agromyces protaetiae]